MKRIVNGFLLLDKPQGMTSNQALMRVKRLFNAKKAGHTGSLDPLATGVLPICFGEATKFSQFLLDADKAYCVRGCLGIKTTTADSEGERILQRDASHVSKALLLSMLDEFRGEQLQVPSMYSALKHNGGPLYKLARQGIEIDRKARPITIHALNCTSFTHPYFDLAVRCSKGTYIRNLVEDIGERLGCGAHVTQLRRTKASVFDLDQCTTLDMLEAMSEKERDERVRPSGDMLFELPSVIVSDKQAQALGYGQSIAVKTSPVDSCVSVYSESGRFLGVGMIDETGNRLKPKRLVQQAC